MKVLQINAVYGKSSTGTIMKHIQETSRAHGIEAYAAFPKGMGKADEWAYEMGSVLDHKLHATLSRIAGKQSYYSHCATKRLLRYMDKLQPDIVHLHNLHSNYIHLNMLLEYLAKHDIATIVTMHDCWYFTGGCFHYANVGCDRWQHGCGNCPKQKDDTPALLYDASASILKDREKYLNAIPRLVMVGCSEWVSNECRKSVISQKDIRTIHNGFNLDIFKPSPSDWRKSLGIEDEFVILAPAGKWLSAVNKATYDFFVKNMTDDMVLVLFGFRDTEGDCPSNVKKIGFIRNPYEMAQVYSMADVMVNCSREDTLSSLNLEAQACGTPVVTYEATGSKETVDGICGFAVETGNPKDLFEATMKVRAIGKTALTSKCVERMQKEFELQTNFEKYIALYKELCDHLSPHEILRDCMLCPWSIGGGDLSRTI